jgi:hypothetical protein
MLELVIDFLSFHSSTHLRHQVFSLSSDLSLLSRNNWYRLVGREHYGQKEEARYA